MAKRITQEEFLLRCNRQHGGLYDYSLAVYVNRRTKVKILCREHGEFEQFPDVHWKGSHCEKCSYKERNAKQPAEDYFAEVSQIHGGEYEYDTESYSGSDKKIRMRCRKHGWTTPHANNHKSGSKCKYCSREVTAKKRSSDRDTFIEKSKSVHGQKYCYDDVVYINNSTEVSITCHIHGSFPQRPNNHTQGQGCPICNESSGEREIRVWLERHDVEYVPQFRDENCRDKRKLPFDFYVPSKNLLIEYDGPIHYGQKISQKYEPDFEATKRRDGIKDLFAQDFGFNLVRIPYFEHDRIGGILSEHVLENELTTSN